MPTEVDWGTKIITVYQADMVLIAPNVYQFDIDTFRLELRALEAGEAGITYPPTHFHNTEITISGTTFVRSVGILSPYTVTISPAGAYQVSCKGANHNVQDVLNNLTGPTFLPNNSAGLVNNASPQDIDAVVDPSGKLKRQLVLQKGPDFNEEVL